MHTRCDERIELSALGEPLISDQEEPKAETTTPIRIVDARTGSRLSGAVARFEPDVEAAEAAAKTASEAKAAADETAAKQVAKATDDEALTGAAKQAKEKAEKATELSDKAAGFRCRVLLIRTSF